MWCVAEELDGRPFLKQMLILGSVLAYLLASDSSDRAAFSYEFFADNNRRTRYDTRCALPFLVSYLISSSYAYDC